MNILLVEDEPLIRKGFTKLLGQLDIEGFHIEGITEAETAEEAECILEKEKFDLIFTDIEMAEINGLTLIQRWKKELPDTQWIIISGYDSFEYAQKAIIYGVTEYVLKPVSKRKMMEAVERCLENRQQNASDFIAATELDNCLEQLEDAIWSLNREKLEGNYLAWKKIVKKRKLPIRYYNDVLSHLLDSLMSRLNNKGSKIGISIDTALKEATIEEADRQFLMTCRKLIEAIEIKRRGNEVDPIEIAKDYIIFHLEREISLEEVAQKLGLNASYFSQLFKKETGETFVKFRIRLRMEKAKELLLRNDVRVIDIPGMIGLNDHPHFTKTFKKYTGQTPSGYRMEMGID